VLPPTRSDRIRSTVVVLAILAMFGVVTSLTADSGSATDGATDRPAVASGSAAPVEGSFLVSGSSTVYPIVLRQAEQFLALEPGVAIAVEGPGSGDGAKKFCEGEAAIANTSRLLKDSEIAICEEAGIEFIEIRRAIDGISVVTSPNNNGLECLSFNDLYALVSEEATGFDSWADANRLTAEWEGQQFPDVALDIYGPGEESGTFDSFTEIVMDSVSKGRTGLDVEDREFVHSIRPDYTSGPDDNVIMEGVSGSDFSLGWVGYAFARDAAAAGRAKLVAISEMDGGDCISPTPESIASGDFPIARFLYTYVNADAANNDPALAAFVDYMMSPVGLESVTAVNYVGLNDADRIRAKAIWTNRQVGRSWE